MNKMKKIGFTLPEALITIGIIGVVAALTVPAFITKISSMVDDNNKVVIEKRLLQGINQLNTMESGLDAVQYQDTESFVWALSKYYKINAICSDTEIQKCFPYSKMSYTTKVGIKDLNVEDLKTPEDFSLSSDDWYAPASFIDAKGTSFAMLLNKNCTKDPSEAMREIPQDCIQYMYDINGSRTPNKLSADIQTSNGLSFGLKKSDGTLLEPIGDYTTYLVIGEVSSINTCAQSQDLKWDTRGSNNSQCANNNWAAAKKACALVGYTLPTKDELLTLRKMMLGKDSYTLDSNLQFKMNEKSFATFPFWASEFNGSNDGCAIRFSSGETICTRGVGTTDGILVQKRQVVCLGNSDE